MPSSSRTVPRFAPEALKANMAPVDLVRAVATRKGATPAQLPEGALNMTGLSGRSQRRAQTT
jgi:aryl-alcohol dehydrogenase-like predicted oxidoreductase